MSLINDARELLGEVFLTGIPGFELSDDTATFLSQAKIGGIIYFGHNYQSAEQIAKFSNQVQSCRSDYPFWIAVDHEGGRVQRFKKDFTLIPTADKLAKIDSPKTLFEIAEMMSRELKAVGVNLNFCPVADINTNPANPIIGDRAFGDNEADVTRCVSAMVRGHMVSGVQPCVKHFPGHGDTSTDSHLELPSVDTTLEVMKEREFVPFTKAFKSRCSMVMTAHIICKSIDPKMPATLSKKIIQGILRDDLRFTRLVISDDLEMNAITDHFGAEEAPKLALEAGCDLLIYRSEKATRHAYAALDKMLQDGELDPKVVIEAAERCRELKKDMIMPYQPTDLAAVKELVGTETNVQLVKF